MNNNRSAAKLIIPLAGITLVFAVVAYVSTFGTKLSESHQHWGEFGSYFGGLVSPVFSLFTLWAVIRTMTDQAEALQIAREEQRQTQTTLKNISDAIFLSSISSLIRQLNEKTHRTPAESAELASLWQTYGNLKQVVQDSATARTGK